MYISAYSTTPCKDYQLHRIIEGILKANTRMTEVFTKQQTFQRFIQLVNEHALTDEIPSFAHPLLINDRKEFSEFRSVDTRHQAFYIYVDVRNCTRIDRDGSFKITSELDYNLLLMRAALMARSCDHDARDLQGLTSFPLTIYTRWLAEQLTRKLALPSDVQVKTTVIVGYYYLCQFADEQTFEQADYLRMATQLAKVSYVTPDVVMGIIESIPRLYDIRDLTNALAEHTGSIRFQQFNIALLYSLMSGSWFGFNSRELVAVSLEHPPTFITMLYMAVNERGFRNTILGRLAKEYDKGDIAKAFIKSVNALVFAPND